MASILKSLRLLADPNRVRLLLLLEHEELSVAELQEILSKGQSQISTHLSQLKQAGLVHDRRQGRETHYSARPQGLKPLINWMNHYGVFWRERFDRLEDLLNRMDQ